MYPNSPKSTCDCFPDSVSYRYTVFMFLSLRNNQIYPWPFLFPHIFSYFHQSVPLPISSIHHRLAFYMQTCCNIPSGYGMKEGRGILHSLGITLRSRPRFPGRFMESEPQLVRNVGTYFSYSSCGTLL